MKRSMTGCVLDGLLQIREELENRAKNGRYSDPLFIFYPLQIWLDLGDYRIISITDEELKNAEDNENGFIKEGDFFGEKCIFILTKQ